MEALRMEQHPHRLIAGLVQQYTYGELDDIPGQWARFAPHIGTIAGQAGQAAYGVMLPPSAGQNGFDYLTGVEVADAAGLPEALTCRSVPAGTYAVFEHRGHVSEIARTWDAIWNDWLQRTGHEVPASPVLLEHYGEEFDPATGRGVVELWLPTKA